MVELNGEIRNRMAAIRASGLFNDAEYEFRGEAALRRQDPVYHYLSSGEARGGRPSRRFDPEYYRRKHGVGGDSPLIHYLLFGRQTGLRTLPAAADFTFNECGLRAGYRQILFLVPEPSGQEAKAAALRLLGALRTSVDAIVLFLDPEPQTGEFEKVAACIAHPSRKLEQGWDSDPIEAAYVVAEVMHQYAPSSAICCGTRGRPIVERLSARFIASIALTLDDAGSVHEGLRYGLYRHSAAILFPTEQLKANHEACYPWIASRKTAILPLLSAEREDVEQAAQGVLSALQDAESLLKDLNEKHRRISTADIGNTAIAPRILNPAEFKSRLKENCIVGGLSTGGAPDFPVPRLLVGFDARRFSAERRLSAGNPAIEYLVGNRFDDFLRPVIGAEQRGSPPASFRAALHGHYYYTDVAEELLVALAANRHPIDLFLSTDTHEKAAQLSAILAKHAKRAEIRVFPNKGRDLGPLFTGYRDLFDAGYDVIGHVHGKKSTRLNEDWGNAWRRFLLNHIVGSTKPMADAIIDAFAQDEKLGLAFPETSSTLGWDLNQAAASVIASKMNMPYVLSIPAFDYPAGSFFWCRPAALEPILALGLDWHDYPDEPIPVDGTIMHAIERIVTFVCEATGHNYTTSQIRDLRL